MPTCTLRAPEGSGGTSTRVKSRPILLVKYQESVAGYAFYRGGAYHFEASDDIHLGLSDGVMNADFHHDDNGTPIEISLVEREE